MNRTEKLKKIVAEKFGGNQAQFAKAIGKAPAQVNHWLTGHRNLGDAGARHIEIVLDLGIGFFDSGFTAFHESRTIASNHNPATSSREDTKFNSQRLIGEVTKLGKDLAGYMGPTGKVPLISWVQAGDWCEAIDNFQPGDADEWFMCPVNHSESTYVLQVRGESMYNPGGRPSFQEGDLIFVDPQRRAEHGSLVVVRLDDEKEVTFKKLVIEGDRKYLKALNPAWPDQIIPINGNATICGVVIFKGEKL